LSSPPSPAAAAAEKLRLQLRATEAAIDSAEAAKAANDISPKAFIFQGGLAFVTLIAGIAGALTLLTWRNEDNLKNSERYVRQDGDLEEVADIR
jgi:hypothetical protein